MFLLFVALEVVDLLERVELLSGVEFVSLSEELFAIVVDLVVTFPCAGFTILAKSLKKGGEL